MATVNECLAGCLSFQNTMGFSPLGAARNLRQTPGCVGTRADKRSAAVRLATIVAMGDVTTASRADNRTARALGATMDEHMLLVREGAGLDVYCLTQ